MRLRHFIRKLVLISVYKEEGYSLSVRTSFQTFLIRSRCAKRRFTNESTLCACGSKLPLILSSLRVLPCSGSPRALETARECVRDWDSARWGETERRGREVSHNLFVYSTKWEKVHCWAEKGWHGMIFLVLGWGKIGGGGVQNLSLSVRERMDVLGNSNKLARSFVALELKSHCSPYWRGL